MIEWHSKKIRRVVKSTLAAEATAMSFGFDRTLFAREVFTEIMFGRDRKWRDVPPNIPLASQLTAESGLTQDLSFPVGMATDCKPLYDVCIRSTTMPTEKRDILDLLDVRHHFDQHPAMYQVRWIPTTATLVDALTKHLSTPKPGHTMGGSGRGGAWRGSGAGRSRAGRDADGSARPGDICPSYLPRHRAYCTCPELLFRSTNKRIPM